MNWQTLAELDTRYGSAFYLFQTKTFASNYEDFLGALRRYYPNSAIAYSYKTNYLPWICRYIDAHGGYGEVVSPMEYALVRKLGIRPERVIVNGPYKEEATLEEALVAGARVNVDSPYELEMVSRIVERHPDRLFAVGLRCNFPVDENTTSRFGFDANGQIDKAADTVRSHANLSLAGLHCHYATRSRSFESYRRRTEAMLEVCGRLFRDEPPRYLDVGGGFFSRMSDELRNQFGVHVPSFDEYAEAIAVPVAEAYPGEDGPELIIEPGTALTADTMQFAARVLDVKTIRGRTVALVNGSFFNTKPTQNRIQLPLSRVSRDSHDSASEVEATDIVGHTCLDIDCLATYSGGLRPGDYVVFGNVGAYTIVLKPPFINPCAPVVAYDASRDEHFLVKRREEPEDIFATYVFDLPAESL